MDASARLEAVETENDMLRERVAQLEAALGLSVVAPIEFQLTAKETRVLGVLMARDIATREAIMLGLYAGRSTDEAEIKIVDVFVCKMRRKLKPFGIDIKTKWGMGFFLETAQKRQIKDIMLIRLTHTVPSCRVSSSGNHAL